MKTILASLIVAGLSFGLSSPNLKAQLINDFSTPLASTFQEVNHTTGTDYVILPASGLSGGAGLALGIGNDTLEENTTSFSITNGGNLSASIFFEAGTPTLGSTTDIALGFTTDPTVGFYNSGTGAGAFISAGLQTTGLLSLQLYSSAALANGTVVQAATDSSVTLTPGDWYKLTDSYNLNSGTFSLTVKLDDYGTLGTGVPVNIRTYTPASFANADVSGDSTLYAGLKGGIGAGALVADNFAAIPEPSIMTLIAGGCGLLCVAGRRRSRN